MQDRYTGRDAQGGHAGPGGTVINADTILSWNFPDIIQDYDAKDAILYALALGIGGDPLDQKQLQFVYEGDLKSLPTMSLVLGFPGPWLSDPAAGVDYSQVVHGEQRLQVVRPLPLQGTFRCVNRVVSVNDLGAEKGAAITVRREIYDQADDQLTALQDSILIARGDGGFSKPDQPAKISQRAPIDQSSPDHQFEWSVLAQLALIYRLTGDLNPLHADPQTAARSGFDRPILHGLASFGIAGFAAIQTLCGGNPDKLKEIKVRFSSPVLPGDTLIFDFWYLDPGEARFSARARERDRTVLSGGRVNYVA